MCCLTFISIATFSYSELIQLPDGTWTNTTTKEEQAQLVEKRNKKTLKINYANLEYGYMVVGLTVSHKGGITCNALKNGKIVSTQKSYVHTQDEEITFKSNGGSEVQCYYNE